VPNIVLRPNTKLPKPSEGKPFSRGFDLPEKGGAYARVLIFHQAVTWQAFSLFGI
jgi:hypothetical protein